MRYLFLALLISNIGLFVWSQKLTTPQNKNFTATDRGIEQIQLLSELSPTKPQPVKTTSPATINTGIQQICYSAGPFDSEATIQAIQEEITPTDFEIQHQKINHHPRSRLLGVLTSHGLTL